jgi:hypothetical protein
LLRLNSSVTHILSVGDATTSIVAEDAVALAGNVDVDVEWMRMAKGDFTSPVAHDYIFRVCVPCLPWEMRHLLRERSLHLHNLGYVTPLRLNRHRRRKRFE